MSRFALAVLVFLPVLGCPTAQEPDPAADSASWWEGEVVVTKADGTPLGDPAPSLLRRSTLPGQERIEEQLVELDANGVGIETLSSWAVAAAEGTFVLQYQDPTGLVEGFGALIAGEDWAWTAWESQAEYQTGDRAGASLRSVAAVNGGLSITTRLISADGDEEEILERSLDPITEGEFAVRYAELLGG